MVIASLLGLLDGQQAVVIEKLGHNVLSSSDSDLFEDSDRLESRQERVKFSKDIERMLHGGYNKTNRRLLNLFDLK